MMLTHKRLLVLLIIVSACSPTLALARGNGDIGSISTIDTPDGVLNAISDITDWVFSGFLAIAVIMVLIAAFNFLVAGGDTEKFTTAKKSLLYSAIAIAIAVLAKSIVYISAALVGAKINP